MGYVLWIFGFMGAHRFYFGKKTTGTIWFMTAGVLGLGWLFDLFWMPVLVSRADAKYVPLKKLNYSVAWILLTFFGMFGIHRFYMGKWPSGLLYLLTAGLFGIGWLYDFWTLNEQLVTCDQA